MERRTPRTVLLVGEAAGTRGGLGADLEACGHHLLYAPTCERALALVAEHGEPVHLLLVRTPVPSAEEMMRVERLRTGSRLGEDPIGRAARTGASWLADLMEEQSAQKRTEGPRACVPLRRGGYVPGMILGVKGGHL